MSVCEWLRARVEGVVGCELGARSRRRTDGVGDRASKPVVLNALAKPDVVTLNGWFSTGETGEDMCMLAVWRLRRSVEGDAAREPARDRGPGDVGLRTCRGC